VKTNDRGRTWYWKTVARTDHGIGQLKRLNVLMATFRARSVLMNQTCSINGRHKSAAENYRSASPLEWNDIFRALIDRKHNSVFVVCNSVVGGREQTQMNTVHACFLLEARVLISIQAKSTSSVCCSIRR
jgi:hypothetical protein